MAFVQRRARQCQVKHCVAGTGQGPAGCQTRGVFVSSGIGCFYSLQGRKDLRNGPSCQVGWQQPAAAAIQFATGSEAVFGERATHICSMSCHTGRGLSKAARAQEKPARCASNGVKGAAQIGWAARARARQRAHARNRAKQPASARGNQAKTDQIRSEIRSEADPRRALAAATCLDPGLAAAQPLAPHAPEHMHHIHLRIVDEPCVFV